MSGLNYQFRFACGDKVYVIQREQKQVRETCQACKGQGDAMVNGTSWCCPECRGYGTKLRTLPAEFHAQPSAHTVGQVRLEYTDSPGRDGEDMFSNYMPQKKVEEAYMLVETGVGSGSVWYSHLLFASLQEAEDAAMLMRAEQGHSLLSIGGAG